MMKLRVENRDSLPKSSTSHLVADDAVRPLCMMPGLSTSIMFGLHNISISHALDDEEICSECRDALVQVLTLEGQAQKAAEQARVEKAKTRWWHRAFGSKPATFSATVD